jgi:ABC-type multidrug transport system ATPase subunit
MIEAFHVGAVSRGETLWKGLNLAAGDGEMWVVTGPPSCGKTFLLQILRGERRPDSGDVVVAGESLYRGSPEHNRRFRASSGMVPESFPAGKGRAVVDLFRLSAFAAGGVSAEEIKRRISELLPLVGLAGAEDVEASSLSVSERARIALAVELFRSPRYLFLDRLLENAGKEWANRLGALLRALAKEDRTILMMERQLPDNWQTAKFPSSRSAGPFLLYHLGSPILERKREAEGPPLPAGSLSETTGGVE